MGQKVKDQKDGYGEETKKNYICEHNGEKEH